jgi:hypothetical protein
LPSIRILAVLGALALLNEGFAAGRSLSRDGVRRTPARG